MIVCIFGLQRSGTHFLGDLIYNNFKCTLAEHGKHRSSIENSVIEYENSINLFIYKNPYKWIDSLTRASYDLYHMNDFKPVSGHTTIEIVLDNTDDKFKARKKIKVSLEKICWHYNQYFNYWLEKTKSFNYYKFIRYETLLFETERVMKEISNTFGIKQVNNIYSFERVYGSKKFSDSHKRYYQNQNVYTSLTKKHIEIIDNNIDSNVLLRLKEYE